MTKEELKKIISTGNRTEITAAVKKYYAENYKKINKPFVPSKAYLEAQKVFGT